MSIGKILDKALNLGYIRIDNNVTKANSKDLKTFTNDMDQKGYRTGTYRDCSADEVASYLQVLNGIFPKTNAMDIAKDHQYTFMQAHGTSQIYDKTNDSEVVAVVESSRQY